MSLVLRVLSPASRGTAANCDNDLAERDGSGSNQGRVLRLRRMHRLLLGALFLIGCNRPKPEQSAEPAPAPAPVLPSTQRPVAPVAPPAPVPSPVPAPAPTTCETPFPTVRLDELARDPKAVEPWGPKEIDESTRTVTLQPSTGRPGDPAAVAAAWSMPLPVAYADFLRRFDGANVRGASRIEIWSTSDAVEIGREGNRPLKSKPGARFLSIGTDGGDQELVIDLDNWSGRGACSVLFVGQGAPDFITFVAGGFAAAIDRVIRGPELKFGEDRIERPSP